MPRLLFLICNLLFVVIISQSAHAQTDSLVLDTTSVSIASHIESEQQANDFHFRPRQLVAPALLLGLGAWGLADDNPVQWIEEHAAGDLNPDGRKCHADEYIQYVPTVTHLVLGFIPGVKAKHNFRDRFIASATSNALMAGVTNAVKYTVKERRPDSTKQNSYFSGHTATAFTGAELVRIEYGWGYGAAAYAVAATTGFLRIYNKRHWVGDVLTGAGIGILCADAGYWLLPVWKRCFGIDRRDAARRAKKENKRTFVATPFYLQTDRAAGLSCSILLD